VSEDRPARHNPTPEAPLLLFGLPGRHETRAVAARVFLQRSRHASSNVNA